MCRMVKHPLAAKRGTLQSQLKLSDIQSVYQWNGISDVVVDFFIRFVSTNLFISDCLSQQFVCTH